MLRRKMMQCKKEEAMIVFVALFVVGTVALTLIYGLDRQV